MNPTRLPQNFLSPARAGRLVALLACWVLALAPVTAETIPATTRPFLWKISQGDSTAYLLGSIHAASSNIYPLDPRIEQAYANSAALVVEANILESNHLALLGQVLAGSTYPAGDGIDKHLTAETWERTRAALDALGLPSDQFQQVKPWFLAMSLTMIKLQSLGVTAENGIDLHFLRRAQDSKPIHELEGAAAQLELISSFTDAEQELFLRYTLAEMDRLETSIARLVTAWKSGDAAGLEALLLESLKESPETKPIYVKLFDDRNRQMAQKIEGYLATGQTHFIVVGAGHLVGETGLLKLLARKYRVTQE